MSTLLIVNPAATTVHSRVRHAIVDSLARIGGLEVCTTRHTLGGDGTVNEAGPGPDVPTLLPIPGGHTNVRALDPLRLGNYLARATLRPDRLDGDSTASDLDPLRLRANEPTLFQVDGDVVGDRREVVLRSVPRALRVGVVD